MRTIRSLALVTAALTSGLVSGLGCAAGDRLYVLMTQLDQSDAAQVSAGAAFAASFRP